MISYTIHIRHMMNAASHIKKPNAYLYKKIVTFVKTVKKRKFKLRAPWGKVFSFIYAAKNAKTLPYYDRYPMVLIMKRNAKKRYFDGLNLHYVNPYYRKILLDGISHLLIPGSDRYLVKEFQETVSKFIQRIFSPCYHRYRDDRVKNVQYLPIPGILPAHFGEVKDQTFIKAGLQRVWMDSLKKISRGTAIKRQNEIRKLIKKAAKKHAQMTSNAKKSSAQVKVKHGTPSRKSATAKRSKASTGKRYRGKKK